MQQSVYHAVVPLVSHADSGPSTSFLDESDALSCTDGSLVTAPRIQFNASNATSSKQILQEQAQCLGAVPASPVAGFTNDDAYCCLASERVDIAVISSSDGMAIGHILDGERGFGTRVLTESGIVETLQRLSGDRTVVRVPAGGPVHDLRVVAPLQVGIKVRGAWCAQSDKLSLDHAAIVEDVKRLVTWRTGPSN